MLKVCTKCGETKPLTAFGKRSDRNDGHDTRCKECRNAHVREYRADNREKHNATRREYVARNREKINARSRERRAKSAKIRATYLKYAYGMSIDDYNTMIEAQNGGCGICGKAPDSGRWGRLYVDHDHETGRVRGLLCRDCNAILGYANDEPGLLRSAANYLEGCE